ncbi:MAG: PilZ domain-containing protein [Deltaproteobacteria bacterium]|nr:PilZ domain-containing protein [Deltaproteobacteria bacterium]
MAEGLVLFENRSLVRRELIYYLKVTDRQTGQELGRIGDIHTGGMLVFTPEPLPVQTIYNLSLELPKAMAGDVGFAELPVKAQALWNHPGPKLSNYYENGFRFLALTDSAQAVIDRLTSLFSMP